MIRFREDGTYIHQGFNIYYPSDKDSSGFILRIWNWKLRMRWSKNVHKWFISVEKIKYFKTK